MYSINTKKHSGFINLPLLLSILVVLGTINKIFSIMAFSICIIILFVKNNKSDFIFLIFFLMPWAGIFKLSPNSQSLFTYLILIFVVFSFVQSKIQVDVLVLILSFACYELLLQVLNNTLYLTGYIKILANFFFIYYTINLGIKKNSKRLFLAYIYGVLSSSFIAFLNFDIFNITAYIQDKAFGNTFGNISRFSGLYGDPNYYAVNIIISLCLVIILLNNNNINRWLALLIGGFLLFFNIQTFSKSAILMLSVPTILFLYSNNRTRKYFRQVIFIILGMVLSFNLLRGHIHFLDIIIRRFMDISSLNELTTGRFQTWLNYLNFFENNFQVLIFGRGLGASLVNEKAAHNTYIDMIYFLGIIGSILYMILIISIFNNKVIIKRTFLNHSIWIVICIMYFFLSELMYIDLPFHLIIAYYVLNIDI